MRKYAIPKVAYVLLTLILICLSIGYTYAYFSSYYNATSEVSLGQLDVKWIDSISGNAISTIFDKPGTATNEANSIAITGELERGGYAEIKANNKEGNLTKVILEIDNTSSSVDVYCRIKLTATYTPQGSNTPVNCNYDWIQLATPNKNVITSSGWFYDNGYYYLGAKPKNATDNTTISLTSIQGMYGGQVVAEYIYLSPDASASLFGSTINITLKLEAVQTTNDAYKSVWTELGLSETPQP